MDNLLEEAAKLLAANTKLNVTYTHRNAQNAQVTDGQLTIIHGNQKHIWCVEEKERITRHRLHKLQLEKRVFNDKKTLIVTTTLLATRFQTLGHSGPQNISSMGRIYRKHP